MACNPREHVWLDRRTFLTAGGIGFCGLQLPGLARAAVETPRANRKIAKSTILIWLSGGPSQIDTWDMKPDAPAEYRGPFQPIQTSAPEITLCEHLPLLAGQAHHLALVRSLGHYGRGFNDHHSGYYYNLTGRAPSPTFSNDSVPELTDWPYMGCVVGAKCTAHPYLPNVISLPEQAGPPTSRRPGQYAARLGTEYDPCYLYGNVDEPLNFTVPTLALQDGLTIDRLNSRRHLLKSIEQSQRALERSLVTGTYGKQQEKAYSLLCAQQSRDALDITQEPESVRERYGQDLNAMSMLMARRLVEAEVPFVTVFWNQDGKNAKKKGCPSGSWDTHGDNFICLEKYLLPAFDRPFSALLQDLAQRELLEETLVVVTSEMGRNPKIGDKRSGGINGTGRDHWTHCMTTLLAGGGIRGGQVYGASDKVAAYPADNRVAPEDMAKTIYYAMGIDDLMVRDRLGRPLNLTDEGEPILDLF